MRLQNHINEFIEKDEAEKVLNDLATSIRVKCKPWLAAIKNCSKRVVWRSIELNDNWTLKKVRKNRKPLDTPTDLHYKADDYFLEKFGWKARSSGLFVNPILGNTSGFGSDTYAVFPLKYKQFLYSPKIPDLYTKVLQWDKYKDTYTDKNLCKALSDTHEIMIDCDSYYAINVDVFSISSLFSKYDKDLAVFVNKWIGDAIYRKK